MNYADVTILCKTVDISQLTHLFKIKSRASYEIRQVIYLGEMAFSFMPQPPPDNPVNFIA